MPKIAKKRAKVKRTANASIKPKGPTPEGTARALKGWKTRRKNIRTAKRKVRLKKKARVMQYEDVAPAVQLVGKSVARHIKTITQSTDSEERSFVSEAIIDQLITEGVLVEEDQSVIRARMIAAEDDGRLDDEAKRIHEDYWPQYDLHEIYEMFWSPK